MSYFNIIINIYKIIIKEIKNIIIDVKMDFIYYQYHCNKTN